MSCRFNKEINKDYAERLRPEKNLYNFEVSFGETDK